MKLLGRKIRYLYCTKYFLRIEPYDYHGKTKLLTYLFVFSMQRRKASQEFPVNPTDVLTNASVPDGSSDNGIVFYLFIDI